MKITLFAAGSRGDVQPCVALSKGLEQVGYRVRLAAPEDFADFVQKFGIECYPLRGDAQRIQHCGWGTSRALHTAVEGVSRKRLWTRRLT